MLPLMCICAWKRHQIRNVTVRQWVSKRKRVNAIHTCCVRLPCSNVDTHGSPYCTNEKTYAQHKKKSRKNNVANITLWTTLKNAMSNVVWEMALPLSYDLYDLRQRHFCDIFLCRKSHFFCSLDEVCDNCDFFL